MFKWGFVEAPREASDVDIREYPFELVRGSPADEGPRPDAFVVEFNQEYLDQVSSPLGELEPMDQIRVKAVLGRPLFKLTLRANREISWNQLQCFQRPKFINSSWSNMCDPLAPAVERLIEAIQDTAEEQGIEPKNETMVVLERHRKRVVARYTMERDGHWAFKRSFMMEKEHTIRDIVLDDDVSVRVRCYNKNPPAGDEWNDPVTFDAGQNRDMWDTASHPQEDCATQLPDAVGIHRQEDHCYLRRIALPAGPSSWRMHDQDEYSDAASLQDASRHSSEGTGDCFESSA